MEKKYRVAILIVKKGVLSNNFNTKDEADTWILELMDIYGNENIKQYRILDRETKNIIEDEKGKRK